MGQNHQINALQSLIKHKMQETTTKFNGKTEIKN